MTHDDTFSEIVKKQCEESAPHYLAFRDKRGAYNELIEIPAMKLLIGDVKGKRLLERLHRRDKHRHHQESPDEKRNDERYLSFHAFLSSPGTGRAGCPKSTA